MGASLTSPNGHTGIGKSSSRFGKQYHMDNFPTSRLPASKSTIGFRDTKHHQTSNQLSNQTSGNSSKSSFINSLSLKKLNISSNKKKTNQINNNNCSNSNLNLINSQPQQTLPTISQNGNGPYESHHNLYQYNYNGLPLQQQNISTICGSINDSVYQDIYANKSTISGGQYIKQHQQYNYQQYQQQQQQQQHLHQQPAAPIHQHTRLLSKNLTKSLSCYTLKFNSNRSSDTNSTNQNGNTNNLLDRKTTVIHASTSELLKCLGIYVCQQCHKLENLQPESVISWIRALDRSLILQGWSEIAFINPANVVFLYMLVKYCCNNDMILIQTTNNNHTNESNVDDDKTTNIRTERDLQCIILTCLYLAYSYMGNEISYPLKPFLIDENRDLFWERCISIVNNCSSKMLSINANSTEFTEYFSELKSYSTI